MVWTEQLWEFKTDYASLNKTWQSFFASVADDIQEDLNKVMEERAKRQISALKRYLRWQAERNPSANPDVGAKPGIYDMGHPAYHISNALFYSQDNESLQIGVFEVYGSRDDEGRLDLAEAYDVGRGEFKVDLKPLTDKAGFRNQNPDRGGKLMRYIQSSNRFRIDTSKNNALAPRKFDHPGFPAYFYKEHLTARYLENLEDDFMDLTLKVQRSRDYGDKKAGERFQRQTVDTKSALKRQQNIDLPSGHSNPAEW